MHPTTDPRAATAGDGPAAPGSSRTWPPPGLEPLAGRLHGASSRLLLGAALLAAALLPGLTGDRPFWVTGPFGEAWWLAPAGAILGLAVALAGLVRLARCLATSARAGRLGYPLSTVLDVASDRFGDGALLRRGGGHYAMLGTAERQWLRRFRRAGAAATVVAGTWALGVLALGLTALGRGLPLAAERLLPAIAAPTLLLLLLAAGCRALDRSATRRAAHLHARQHDGTGADPVDMETDDGPPDDVVPPPAAPAFALTAAAWAVRAVAVLLALPVLGLVAVMIAGPLLVGSSRGDGGSAGARAAGLALFLDYALPADPGITPQEAGEAMQALSHVGQPTTDRPLQRAPVRQHAPWTPAGERPESLPPVDRLPGSGVLARAAAGQLSPAEVAYLRQVAEHPAQEELAVLGRAAAADVSGARWQADAIRNVSYLELTVTRLAPMRLAAHAGIARAAVQVADGRVADGEETLRSVMGAGLLLAREGTGFLDLITGASMVETGALALAELYRATGRSGEAAGLDRLRQATQSHQALARSLSRRYRPSSSLEWWAALAADPDRPVALRWEALQGIALQAPCFNARSALFGPGESYHAWLGQVRQGLARYPADDALFASATTLTVPDGYQRRAAVARGATTLVLGSGAADRCALLLALVTSRVP